MEGYEERLLRRLLSFCREKEMIGPHHRDGDDVVVILESEPHKLKPNDAVRLLSVMLEQSGLADEFQTHLKRPPDVA